MNREILFKAKRKDNNEWVYGFYTNNLNDKTKDDPEQHFIITSSFEYFSDYKECNALNVGYYEVIPETVLQYTGLDDKNGNKIFENDVILYNTGPYGELDKRRKGKVVYDDEFNRFAVFENGACSWGVNQYLYNIEVIGNKFDNPELLEKEVK